MKTMSSKNFVSILLIGMFAFCISLTSAQAAGEKELVVMTWGGAAFEAQKKAFFDPFTQETGIKIIPVTSSGDMYGRVAAQIKSGNVEWDIVWPDQDVMEAAAQKGLVEPVDYSIVTETKDLIPGAVNKWGVGNELVTFLVTYSTKAFPGENHPKSWADFYDVKKFPGPRASHNWGTPTWQFMSALLADGVPPDKLVPIDYARAFAKLDQIKSSVKVWYQSGDKMVQSLVDGEVVMAHSTGARARMARDMGAPTELVWNQAIYYLNFWSVVKGAPHKEAAMQFLNFTNRPKQQAIYTNTFGSALTNTKSLEFVDPEKAKDLPTNQDNFRLVVPALNEKSLPWLIEHNDEMNEKWNEWISK